MFVVLVACSSRAPTPARPTPDKPIGSGHGPAVSPAAAKVSEADCLATIDHVIKLDVEERPADQQLSADEVNHLRAQLRTSFLPVCLEQPRTVLACMDTAATRAAIRACDR